MKDTSTHKRQWRDYRTAAGGRPVHKFLMDLSDEERASIVAAMKEVRRDGLSAAKHLRGDLYEVKADTADKFFRVIFAAEGRYNHVLLSLEAFAKKTRKRRRRSSISLSGGCGTGGCGAMCRDTTGSACAYL